MLGGLRPDQRFVSIERDARLHEAASGLRDLDNVRFLLGDWREILEYGPFTVLFVDVAEAKDEGADEVIRSLATGGIILLDDFTPEDRWPETWRGEPDERRELWLNDPRLAATEILTTPSTATILAARVY